MESQVLERICIRCAPRSIHIYYIDKQQGRNLPLRLKLLLLSSFGLLGAILGTSLHTTVDTLSIESTTDDVVTDTRKVLHTAAADHNHRVLLQVVADTGDVSSDFVTVGQTHTSDLTQSGVGLLRGRGTNCGADASLLRSGQVGLLILQGVQALLHCGRCGLVGNLLSAFSYQLVKSGHCFPPFFKDELVQKSWQTKGFPGFSCRPQHLLAHLAHTS